MDYKIKNPYRVTVEDIVIKKFGGGDPMSIFPQFVEFVLYQSVFSPILKAQIVIHDVINLLNGYPLVGEETFEVYLKQEGARVSTEAVRSKLTFVVAGITNVEFGHTGRDQTYLIDLHSVEGFENAKRRISKAYKSSAVEDFVEDIVRNYLTSQKDINYLSTDPEVQERALVVPNLKPFAAIQWLSRMMVPSKTNEYHNYVFFETLYEKSSRFNFKPFQRYTYRDSVDEGAYRAVQNKPFFYISNYELASTSSSVIEGLVREGFAEERLVLNLKINKRFSVLEKIIGGYFKNEYFEIDMNQKMHKTTQTAVTDQWKSLYYQKHLQTNNYIQDVISASPEPETSARVKYAFNNFDLSNDPLINTVWGKKEISKLALSQIDLSVDVHTDLQVVPGDLIYVNIPEMHGFENAGRDRYITGHFFITESKMVIRSTGETTMLLRINKDSYFTPINTTKTYGLEGG